MNKVTIEIDDSTTVSGLPAPEYWMCIDRRQDSDGVYGRAWQRTRGEGIRVIESIATRVDGKRWLHVSVSKPNRKMPTWDDIQTLRKYFVGEHRECYMIFPPKNRYVDLHPAVLHLYCCLDQPDGVLPHMEGNIAGILSI